MAVSLDGDRMLMERIRWQEPAESTLDEAHLAVWEAIRHLFPSRAIVNQTDDGWLMVTWAIEGLLASHFAAPVMIRIQPGLLLALWTCDDADDRDAIARSLELVVAAHLAGYDPASRIPTCGVIVLGE
jgi:hypothetical protein